jgi:hypothetical protein
MPGLLHQEHQDYIDLKRDGTLIEHEEYQTCKECGRLDHLKEGKKRG